MIVMRCSPLVREHSSNPEWSDCCWCSCDSARILVSEGRRRWQGREGDEDGDEDRDEDGVVVVVVVGDMDDLLNDAYEEEVEHDEVVEVDSKDEEDNELYKIRRASTNDFFKLVIS